MAIAVSNAVPARRAARRFVERSSLTVLGRGAAEAEHQHSATQP